MSVHYYQYQASDALGNVTTGQLSAESEREAVAILQARKLVPIKLKTATRQNQQSTRSTIRNTDLVEFTNGLTTLVEARVPIDRALLLLEGLTEKESMRRLVVSLRRDVKEGKSLADAMEMRPDVFSRLYVNIVRAGETGGILDQLLPDLAASMEAAEETRRQIGSALAYPLILLVVGVLSVVLLLIYAVPQFALMFEDVGSVKPASIEFLMALSSGLASYGWLSVPLVLLLAYGWRRWNADENRRRRKDAFFLQLPMAGRLLLYRDSAVFSRTLGALLGAGIPLIRGLRVATEVVSNTALVQHLKKVEEDVRGGSGLGLALEKTGMFPVLLHQLVAVGEETGRTGVILKKLATTFDLSVRNEMDRLVKALQPALIIFLGIAVGGIIVVMLSAVLSINTVDF
ncbi:MAG: type II secretion system F family protein [Pseudomonadales bacterium]|nr:type II secretion system F family protein [Pseudomonadales bacterium]